MLQLQWHSLPLWQCSSLSLFSAGTEDSTTGLLREVKAVHQVLHLHPLLHHLGWLELLKVFPQARGEVSGKLCGRPTQLGEQLDMA